jgi:protein TonB
MPEDQIARNTVYPPIAQRSGIEGRVILELFIDRHGVIRDISILQETPLNRGFGEAAVNAFRGISAAKPAEANGVPVATRYRYPFRFTLR